MIRFSRRSDSGAALLLVLWLLAILVAVVATFALTARTEHLQGRHLRTATEARYAAEAGLEYAVLRLLDPDPVRHWQPDGRAYPFSFEGFEVEVRVVDESGKVDLNVADPELLARLFMALEVEEPAARELAAAVLDWRDLDDLLSPGGGAEDGEYAAAGLPHGAKDRPFDLVPELQQVLGMDHELFRRVEPYVTVFTGLARPNPAFAQAPVLTALGIAPADIENALALRTGPTGGLDGGAAQTPGGQALAGLGTGTYSISSRAVRGDGTVAQIHATVRVGASGQFGQMYAPLQWREGEPY